MQTPPRPTPRQRALIAIILNCGLSTAERMYRGRAVRSDLYVGACRIAAEQGFAPPPPPAAEK
jgi:hypothetical protein